MPTPNEIRGPFLKYLRQDLPHNKHYRSSENVFSPKEVRQALLSLQSKDPMRYRILHKYTHSRDSRSKIAESENYDASTIKRRLDQALDIVLQELGTMQLRPIPDSVTIPAGEDAG